MRNFPSMRLLPVVMLVISVLIAFKVADHAFSPAVPAGAAQAQELDAVDAETDERDVEAGDAALQESEDEVMADPPDTEEPSLADADGGDGEAVEREFSDAEREVLESLLERRKQIDERERQIQLREKLLEAAEKRVEERVGELKAIEARIETSFGKQEEERKAQLQNLVGMYENMKPKDAARIFDRLEMSVLLGVVQQMKARKMSPILAKMDAAVAQRLTVELARVAAEQSVQ